MAPTSATHGGIQLLNLPAQPTIHHRLFLLVGRANGGGGASHQPNPNGPDGWIEVCINDGSNRLFPNQRWEVNDSWFKALIPLGIGNNYVRLTHKSLQGHAVGEQTFQLAYRPVPSAKKVRLVVLCGKDSAIGKSPARPDAQQQQQSFDHSTTRSNGQQHFTPALPNRGISKFLAKAMNKLDGAVAGGSGDGGSGTHNGSHEVGDECTIDCPPGWRRQKLQHDGDLAISRRLALQTYLWQAFHAEQMYRHGFGHRTFSLDERPEAEVTDLVDIPRIEFVRSKYTMAEIRDPDWAQQNPKAKHGGKTHSIASEAVNDQPFCQPGDACAVLLGDAHWDPEMKLLRGHAAVGAFAGINDKPSVGVMGSHWLWAAPQALSEVTDSFMDQEPTDQKYCCNDLGEGRTASLTVNIGSGAMLHEAGHALSNPHYPTGFMNRGYTEFNRAFMTRETHSLAGSKGPFKPITPECDSGAFHIHRCQAVRASLHPAFSHPNDPPPVHYPSNPSAWSSAEPVWKPTSKGAEVGCLAGVAMVEIEVGGDFKTHIEWLGRHQGAENTPPLTTLLTPEYISQRVGFDVLAPSSPEVKLTAVGCNLRSNELNSYRRMAIAARITIPGVDMGAFGREVRNGIRTKTDDDPLHGHWTFLFHSAWENGPKMVQIDVFSGASLNALGFRYSDGSSQSVGRIHADAKPKATLHLAQGDRLDRVEVRSGWWVDAARVILASGQATEFCGGGGGGLRSLAASQGEEIVGLVGSAGDWLDTLGVLVADRRA